MSIATNTADTAVIREEFTALKALFDDLRDNCFGLHSDCRNGEPRNHNFDTLSAGMTSDYPLAIECGSNMVRIGSLIFGER